MPQVIADCRWPIAEAGGWPMAEYRPAVAKAMAGRAASPERGDRERDCGSPIADIRLLYAWRGTKNPQKGASRPARRTADFQTCRVADFQVCRRIIAAADLQIGEKPDFEVLRHAWRAVSPPETH
jgi:hypothetical protein